MLMSLATLTLGLLLVPSMIASATAAAITEEEAHAIGVDAYLYFYPLVTMDITRRQLTNMEPSKTSLGGPMNYFANIQEFPAADNARGGTAELRHALFQRLARPDQGAGHRVCPRYWRPLLSAADARHVDRRVRVAGLAHDGEGRGQFPCNASGWSGTAPAEFTRIDAPTPYVWIIGRTETDGPADYDAVHKIQDGYKLTPLSQWAMSRRRRQ